MPRLPSLSSRKIIRALLKNGFVEAPDRGKGSQGKDIPRGTLFGILDAANIPSEDFLDLL